MATKKKVPTRKTVVTADAAALAAKAAEAYELALKDYRGAVETLHRGDFQAAASSLEEIIRTQREEPQLVERARVYLSICRRKLAPAAEAPQTADERFYRAVMLNNDGKSEEAIRMLDEAIQQCPNDPKLLYARASAWAVKGNAEAAVTDLRQAILAEPQVRFQAVNDPDFERVREEPAFIDIIEPTPAGA